MKLLIAGAGILLAATATPALANGGGGGQNHSAQGHNGFGNFAGLLAALRAQHAADNGYPGFFSGGKHFGWSHGRHWGWFKPHNPHWPHDHPASP